MIVKVCVGSNCTLLGSMNIIDQIEDLNLIIAEDAESFKNEKIEVEAIKCLGYCKEGNKNVAPVVILDTEPIFNATSQTVMEKIVNKLKK